MQQTQFTEVDFYKSMLNIQVLITELTKKQCPVEQNGKLAYPVDDGGISKAENDIKSLKRALAILKQDNS